MKDLNCQLDVLHHSMTTDPTTKSPTQATVPPHPPKNWSTHRTHQLGPQAQPKRTTPVHPTANPQAGNNQTPNPKSQRAVTSCLQEPNRKRQPPEIEHPKNLRRRRYSHSFLNKVPKPPPKENFAASMFCQIVSSCDCGYPYVKIVRATYAI
ncbi:hypothetical protein CHS0354_002526 [Potamilus streckersoni]|uniref:Uncharacterized protein n=1 Tax=Potamilus streckersoni TaxID=2493646 RepID=A0AAE0W1G4_9BIVA|nr:hypothetical protein CHS0354_002526 [Potamilus streckersoni]